MDRRSFLSLLTSAKKEQEAAGLTATIPVAAGIKRYKGAWNEQQVAQLLRRTMFGATAQDIDHFKHKSLKKAVKELVYADHALPEPPINNYNDDKYTDD